jgi:hypothetical protein
MNATYKISTDQSRLRPSFRRNCPNSGFGIWRFLPNPTIAPNVGRYFRTSIYVNLKGDRIVSHPHTGDE